MFRVKPARTFHSDLLFIIVKVVYCTYISGLRQLNRVRRLIDLNISFCPCVEVAIQLLKQYALDN